MVTLVFFGLFLKNEGSAAFLSSPHLSPSRGMSPCVIHMYNRPIKDNNHSLVSLNVDFNQDGGYYFPINHLSF